MTGRGRLVSEFAGTLTKAGKKAVPAPLINWPSRRAALTILDCHLSRDLHYNGKRLIMKKERSKRRPRRFWTPKEDELLGKASDAEIGRRLGRTKSAVQQRRRNLHVTARHPKLYQIPPRRWTAVEDRLLGTAVDRDVAQQLGRTKGSVAIRRRALGIDNFSWTRYRKRIEALAAGDGPAVAHGS